MPVFNALPFLDESIRSILGQTFQDFEFVILDDGSTDGSGEALREWAGQDRRIRVIESGRRLGPAGSSNRVVQEARAPIVARMDADDVVPPHRLERQMYVLARAPDAVLVAGLCETIDARGRRTRRVDRSRLLRASPFAPFAHGSIMFRREAFTLVGGYREATAKWEDIDFYLRLADAGRMLVVNDILLRVRHSLVSTRLTDDPHGLERAMDLMYRCMREYIRTGSYEPLLLSDREAGAQHQLVPQSFVACGSVHLWAGQSPRLFRRLCRLGALRFDAPSAQALVWTAWAELSSATLRAALRMMLAVRNVRARRSLEHDSVVEWQPRIACRGAAGSQP